MPVTQLLVNKGNEACSLGCSKSLDFYSGVGDLHSTSNSMLRAENRCLYEEIVAESTT